MNLLRMRTTLLVVILISVLSMPQYRPRAAATLVDIRASGDTLGVLLESGMGIELKKPDNFVNQSLSQTSTPTLSDPYPPPSDGYGFQQPLQQEETPPVVPQEELPGGTLTYTVAIPVTGTATLIPLPEITMQFPIVAVTEPAIPTPPVIPPASISAVLNWVTPTRVMIVIFITFVWLFLGGWFYSTIRRLD